MFYEKAVNNFLNSEQRIIYEEKRVNSFTLHKIIFYSALFSKKLMIWYGISLTMCFWQRIILTYTNSNFTSRVWLSLFKSKMKLKLSIFDVYQCHLQGLLEYSVDCCCVLVINVIAWILIINTITITGSISHITITITIFFFFFKISFSFGEIVVY